MPIEFEVSGEVAEIARRTAEVVRRVVLPAEQACGGSVHDGPEPLRRQLQDAARQAGVFAPHAARRWGGLGLDLRDQAVVFEEAGYALLGPLALNCAAPDEGNMHLLEQVATPGQQERYLRPLAAGELRSCFAMTEPAPGAGSDPRALATTAAPVPGGWRIDGRKWFISGADGAGFAICMRSAFGRPLAELGMVQQMLADSEIDIEAGRALLWRACWELDQGRPGAQYTSITKTFVAEAVNRVVDRAVQVCGAMGISADLPLARLLREIRAFRIYDGPSETHRWAIARRAVRAARDQAAT